MQQIQLSGVTIKCLGKPLDFEDAKRILKEISGNTHEVITGVSLFSLSKEITFSDSTKVTFETLSEEEICYYVDKFKPYDKAGAYGIQEWIGLIACSHIDGSYFNVVGLPVQKLYKELQKFIIHININDKSKKLKIVSSPRLEGLGRRTPAGTNILTKRK